MKIIINHSSMIPIYEQLIHRIKASIVSGELKPGEMLPSVRTLSAKLEISALTVKKAYDRLEEEGILVTVHGKGSFVSEQNAGMIAEQRLHDAETVLANAVAHARSAGFSAGEIRELLELILEDTK